MNLNQILDVIEQRIALVVSAAAVVVTVVEPHVLPTKWAAAIVAANAVAKILAPGAQAAAPAAQPAAPASQVADVQALVDQLKSGAQI